MKVHVELTRKELDESGCGTVEEFKASLIRQLNDGVIGDAGEVGEDWLPAFTVDVALAE